MSINTEAFFALLRAGLWEKEVRLLQYNALDFKEVLRIAEEQSVVGLVAAGYEHIEDYRVPQADVLTIAGKALQIEQQNIAMNQFVAELFAKLQTEKTNALLVKGQGVAQCYEKPLWRVCGDVDLLLYAEKYKKAKEVLSPFATKIDEEIGSRQHLALSIGQWTVELHGTLRTGLGKRIDTVIDDLQEETFQNKLTRIWKNGAEEVYLPNVDSDVLFVFAHIIQHFFQGGVGLRQVCDWCRLLWTYKDTIDKELLYKRLKAMGLLSEWRVFASFAVDQLGMPPKAMPFYDKRYQKKAKIVLSTILKSGNFGHNKDISYYEKYSGVVRKSLTMMKQAKESAHLARVFPLDAPRFFVWFVVNKTKEIA